MKRSFMVSFGCALVALLAIAFLNDQPTTTTLILLADAIVLNILLRGSLIKTFLVGMVFGVVGEALTTHYGVWEYSSEQFLGMPLFIPLMWGICAILFAGLASNLKEV